MNDKAKSLNRLYNSLRIVGVITFVIGGILFFNGHWYGVIITFVGMAMALSSLMYAPPD